MSLESVALLAVLSILALGTLYAVSGDRVSEKWRTWTAKASIAAAAAFGIGTLLLGIPGAFFLEAVTSSGLKLQPDSAWPLSILITQVGALLILPASLVLRFALPSTVGWGHAGATAILTFVATLLFTILVVPTYAQL